MNTLYKYQLKNMKKLQSLKIYNNKDLIDTRDLFAQKEITTKNIFFKGIPKYKSLYTGNKKIFFYFF